MTHLRQFFPLFLGKLRSDDTIASIMDVNLLAAQLQEVMQLYAELRRDYDALRADYEALLATTQELIAERDQLQQQVAELRATNKQRRGGVRSVFWCQVRVRRGITGSGKQNNGLAGSNVSARKVINGETRASPAGHLLFNCRNLIRRPNTVRSMPS